LPLLVGDEARNTDGGGDAGGGDGEDGSRVALLLGGDGLAGGQEVGLVEVLEETALDGGGGLRGTSLADVHGGEGGGGDGGQGSEHEELHLDEIWENEHER